jgi:opacity protein-like surface antigen
MNIQSLFCNPFPLLLLILFSLTLINPNIIMAQDTDVSQAAADSSQSEEVSPWSKSWVVSINATQYNYQDWSYGGNNAFSFTANTLFELIYTHEKFLNTSRVRLRFGQSRLKEGELEKIEDIIRISNRIEYALNNNTWSAFLELAFRTQFTDGFDPVTNERTSDFLSPAYYIENIGISYKPADFFSSYLGIGLKQTLVETDGLDQFYGLGEDEDVRSEGGLTLAYELNKEILPNITLNSEFNAFYNLLLPIENTDIFVNNSIIGEINEYFQASLDVDLMYDSDFGQVLQRKTVIALGIRLQIL